jgi:uncharacterized protein YjbI with pentapeptide repeats
VGGRVDLRGFHAPQPRSVSRADVAGSRAGSLPPGALAGKAELVELVGVPLRGLDLSGALLDRITIRDCVVEDCVLDEIRGHDLGIARSRVRDTSFRGADLQGAVLGPWRGGVGNEYSRVDFTGADLRVYRLTAWFRDCDFSGARLDEARFIRCGLVRCRFSGILQDVLFNGNMPAEGNEGEPNYCEDIDMSGTTFRNVQFRGFDVDAVKLPDDPALQVVRDYARVARSVIQALEGRKDKDGHFLWMWFSDQLRGIDAGHPVGVLNRSDFAKWGGEGLAALAESAVAQAKRECGVP